MPTMLAPETRSSTPRSARCTSAGRLDDKLEVGQAAHQQTTPAPGDEAAIQDRCRAVVLVGADEAPELLLESDRGLRENGNLAHTT